jgi:hypothetical protein
MKNLKVKTLSQTALHRLHRLFCGPLEKRFPSPNSIIIKRREFRGQISFLNIGDFTWTFDNGPPGTQSTNTS